MIYCVEDDNGIRNLMLYTLNTSGFEAKGFADSASFWKAIENETPELILLDIMLPGEDGISMLKKLRSNVAACDIPIIMASAKGTEYDKVFGQAPQRRNRNSQYRGQRNNSHYFTA